MSKHPLDTENKLTEHYFSLQVLFKVSYLFINHTGWLNIRCWPWADDLPFRFSKWSKWSMEQIVIYLWAHKIYIWEDCQEQAWGQDEGTRPLPIQHARLAAINVYIWVNLFRNIIEMAQYYEATINIIRTTTSQKLW